MLFILYEPGRIKFSFIEVKINVTEWLSYTDLGFQNSY